MPVPQITISNSPKIVLFDAPRNRCVVFGDTRQNTFTTVAVPAMTQIAQSTIGMV